MVKRTENRQRKTSFLILFLVLFWIPYQSIGQNSQEKSTKVDYSIKSNILDPDTLQGDQKKVFWHFVDLTHEETEALEPLFIKAEFEKLGIYTSNNDRFLDAFIFFDTDMIYHKKSCEQWAYFKFLEP